MTPKVRFTEFLADIEPSETTKSNASSAHTKLRATLREDANFAPLHKNTLLSGSYKQDTAIRPRIMNGKTNRPDVDILVITKHSLISSPEYAVDDVFDVLTRHYTPTNRQSRSVSVSTRLVDMDVVPIIEPYNDGTYYIPDRNQQQWLLTNPPGHTAWTTETNNMVGGRFKPLVKMFKWWRRENSTVGKRPKGFVLEVITADCMNREETHYGELFVQMLETIVERYAYSISLGTVPQISDPSLPANNITDGLSFAAFQGFYDKVKNHAIIGREALSLDDQGEATEKWRILFGNRFPKPPVLKAAGLLDTAPTVTGAVFPTHPVRPPNKPAGFA